MNRLNFEGAFQATPSLEGLPDAPVSHHSSSSQFNIQPSLGRRTKTPTRRLLDDDSESSTSRKMRKEEVGEYKDLFTENMLLQSMNHEIQNEVLKLQRQKIEIEIETRKIELEKAKALAKIEIDKQKQLAEMELEKRRREMED